MLARQDDFEKKFWWGDEDFHEDPHEGDNGFVMVDAHILCTPAIADLDGDGSFSPSADHGPCQ